MVFFFPLALSALASILINIIRGIATKVREGSCSGSELVDIHKLGRAMPYIYLIPYTLFDRKFRSQSVCHRSHKMGPEQITDR